MGAELEVYKCVRPTMGAVEGGVVAAVAVLAICLRRRAWSLRRAAAERLPLRTIEWSLRTNCVHPSFRVANVLASFVNDDVRKYELYFIVFDSVVDGLVSG